MSSANLILLAGAIGADVKLLRQVQGDLTKLPTTAKDNLVNALIELHALASAPKGAQIDDTATNGDVDVTWSADKIFDSIAQAIVTAKSETKNELLDGAGAAYDTFKELQDLLVGQEDAVSALTTAVGNRVRFDQAQVLTDEQKGIARSNIGAASTQDVTNVTAQITTVSDNLAALVDSLGDVDADLVAAYNAAKA